MTPFFLKYFLKYGMMPKEIPQPFNSYSFGEAIINNLNSLPSDFEADGNNKVSPSAKIASHDLLRVETKRRKLGIPNPIRYFNLAEEIVFNWDKISDHYDKEQFSATRPVIDSSGRRAVAASDGFESLSKLRVSSRSGQTYLLSADVQKFYGNIYTHSIPWAFHGKKKSKGNRSLNLIGNLLDNRVQSIQDQQTNGIPIGPDTSFVLAESILTAVDVELRREASSMRGFRLIDDYELAFSRYYEAEEALYAIRAILSRYDLELNERKTSIRELPLPFTSPWVRLIRDFEFRDKRRDQMYDLLDYFSMSFRLSEEHSDAPVLKYAISKVMRKIEVKSFNFKTYESLLLQCANSEPGTISRVLSELLTYEGRQGIRLSKDDIGECIKELIHRHARNGHGSEVAWSIWMAIQLNVDLLKGSLDLITQMEDPLIPLLTLHAREEGLTPNSFTGDVWLDLLTADELFGRHWLTAYEAGVRGWLRTQTGNRYLKNYDSFKFLMNEGVRFYNTSANGVYLDRRQSNGDLLVLDYLYDV